MNEDALVRDTVSTIAIALIDVCRNAHDVDRIAHQLLDEFDVLLETPERAARAMLMFASLCADALAFSADSFLPSRLGPAPAADARDADLDDVGRGIRAVARP